MNPGFFASLLDQVARKIADLARGLWGRLSSLLRRTKNQPSGAELSRALDSFERPYLETLAEAETQITGRRVTPEQVRRRIVGDIRLSKKLYKQRRQTEARVRRILKDHAKYAGDARKLAMEIYEGYGFRRKEALRPKVRLPKYLNDALLNRDMDALLARIQASTLKTDGLRAAYLKLLDDILAGNGQAAIERSIRTAVEERYRHFANRIAQTELARIHMNQQAEELMAEPAIQVVQYCLSGTHPVEDICDLFAGQNAYGLGPGLYPKPKAPKPPIHPHCRCYWRPRPDRALTGQERENPGAGAEYLAGMNPKEAARVAGSAAKRDAVAGGANIVDLLNEGRPDPYKIGRLGDGLE